MKHPETYKKLKDYIQSELERMHPDFNPVNICIGKRRDVGVYSYYKVDYFCAAKFKPGECGWKLQGSSDTTFRFDNDNLDSSMRSCSL